MRDSGRVETVYNFEVEGFHTYFVGEAGVWAHNLCIDMRQLTKLVMKHGKDFQIYKDWSKAMAPVARGAQRSSSTHGKFNEVCGRIPRPSSNYLPKRPDRAICGYNLQLLRDATSPAFH